MNNAFRKEPDAEKPHVRNSVRDTFGNGCIYSTTEKNEERKAMFRPIRRKKKEMDLDAAKELLQCSRRGVLAVNGDDGYPYAVPVNYFYDSNAGKIYFPGITVIKIIDRNCIRISVISIYRKYATPAALQKFFRSIKIHFFFLSSNRSEHCFSLLILLCGRVDTSVTECIPHRIPDVRLFRIRLFTKRIIQQLSVNTDIYFRPR